MTDFPPVLVAGMHRCGTSAVSQVLVALGMDAGPFENLIGATKSNRHGHFEVKKIMMLNEAMLHELGGSWLSIPPRSCEVSGLFNLDFADQASETLSRQFGKLPWFLKDPRLSLLLPFWRQVLPQSPVVIAVVRSPRSIAQSLFARDGIPFEYGVKLAGSYLNTLIRDIEGLNNIVVHYEELLKDPEGSVRAVKGFLTEQGIPLSGSVSDAAALLDEADNHHALAKQSDDESLLSWHGKPLDECQTLPSLLETDTVLAQVLTEKMELVGQRDHFEGLAAGFEAELSVEQKRSLELVGQRDHFEGLAAGFEAELSVEQERMKKILDSRSWRLTKPFRKLAQMLKK